MSDYLTNLLIRTRYPERTIQPRLSSMFDPVSPGSMAGEVPWWFPGEEPDRAVNLNEQDPRPDQPARQSLNAPVQGREEAGPIFEQEAQQRKQTLESSAALGRRHSFRRPPLSPSRRMLLQKLIP